MLEKLLPIFIIVIAFCGCAYLKTPKEIVTPQTNKEDFINQIKRVDCEDADRLRAVERLFNNMGVDEREVEVVKDENVANVLLTVKGKTDETVVVGAHYDKTTKGCGAIDNWTGIVLLANLHKNFRAKNNEKTYKFVAFGKEEQGLIGSIAMVNKIAENDRSKYCAMVNFDSFGFTDVWTLETMSDASLIKLAEEIALERDFTLEIKSFVGASADSKSFRKKNIPAITLSGLDDKWRDYLHQDKDQLENINFDKVFENFLFSYDYLNEIDAMPCESFR